MFAFFHPVLAKATAALAAGAAFAKRLHRDRGGNVAMMFVFLAMPLCGAIGLAVDMGRVYHVAMHTQGALDSAALAAGRVAQLEKTDTLRQGLQVSFGLLRPGQAQRCGGHEHSILAQLPADGVHGDGHLVGPHPVPRRAEVHRQPRAAQRRALCVRGQLLRLREAGVQGDGADLPQLQRRWRRQRRRRHQPRDLHDARRHGLDVRPGDHSTSRRQPRT